MVDLLPIKSERLRALIKASFKFNSLPEADQKTKIKDLSKHSTKRQEEIFCPFFEEENAKERINMQKVLLMMSDKLSDIEGKIDRLEREDIEEVDRTKESAKQEHLLNQLKSI